MYHAYSIKILNIMLTNTSFIFHKWSLCKGEITAYNIITDLFRKNKEFEMVHALIQDI